MEWISRKCHDLLPLEEFFKDCSSKLGHKSTCKACLKKQRTRAQRRLGYLHGLTISQELAIQYRFVIDIYLAYDFESTLHFPVKTIGATEQILRGCYVAKEIDHHILYIKNGQRYLSYNFATTEPLSLIGLLKESGLELDMPIQLETNQSLPK